MKNKTISALLLSLLVWCIPTGTTARDEGGAVKSFTCDDSGYCEIIGYTDDASENWITLILADIPPAELSGNCTGHVMHIWQENNAIGNNGTFYLRFSIDPKWSGSDYYLNLNAGGDIGRYAGTIGEISTDLERVPDNCLRVGNDIYSLTSDYYTPDDVSGSLADGGNHVYYKIGGYWFNVLDEDATSAAYFTLNNAVGMDAWQAWDIENYYYDYNMPFEIGG